MRRMLLVVSSLLVLSAFGTACSSEPEIDGRTASEWTNLLMHQDWAVQDEASEALARLGHQALPYLKHNLKAKDPSMRRGVVKTLTLIGPKAKSVVPHLLSRIGREEVDVIRASILEALTAIDPKNVAVQQEFHKRLRDVDSTVRVAAQKGIDAIKPPPEPKPEPKTAPVKPAKAEFVLRAAVAAELAKDKPGLAFGLIGEVIRADRRAAIIWPAIAEGKILDDDVVAMVFERKGENPWHKVGQVGPLQGSDAAAKLAEALGGADNQKVVRNCGVPRDELAGYLSKHGLAFQTNLEKGDASAAMKAFEELTHAFSYSLVAYDDALEEMLVGKAFVSPWKIDVSVAGNKVPAEAQVGGKAVYGQLDLRPCGGGVVIGKFIEGSKPPDAPGGAMEGRPSDEQKTGADKMAPAADKKAPAADK